MSRENNALCLLGHCRGRLISEHFSVWLQSPKKGAKSRPFFGDWSQSEKLSEINPPLIKSVL